jgi:hypothetical protein
MEKCMKLVHFFFVLSLSILASGCSTYSASRYSIDTDNIEALHSLKGKTANVGAFTSTQSGLNQIMCRGVGPIKTPDGEPFSEYVKKALVNELKMANLYSVNAPVTLTANLDDINFSSASGNWNIALTVRSSNGKSLSVSEKYAYTSSFLGETACNQTAQALMPAVQDLLGKLVSSKRFPALLQHS